MTNVLFADDNQDILKAYKDLFQNKSLSSDNDKDFTGDSFNIFTALQGGKVIDIIKQCIDDDNPVEIAFISANQPPCIVAKEMVRKLKSIDPLLEIVIIIEYKNGHISDFLNYIGGADKLLFLKKPFDIEEVKQLALYLGEKYQNDRSKERLMANVSHELLTPMTSILGFSDLLLETDCSKDEVKTYAKIINNNSLLLEQLIRDLIYYTV